jgi:dienelactone hydrolase
LNDAVDASIDWAADQEPYPGVLERFFQLSRPAGNVPAVLWRPAAAGPGTPLVLLGHGGSGHKRSERITDHARWFASHAGIAALAIDLPYHGDRVDSRLSAAEYQRRIAAEGIETVLDRTNEDWLAAVDAVAALGIADPASIGYLGQSMGARFGLPLAAALGSRLRCAVLGKYGLRQGPDLNPGLAARERSVSDAKRVTAPVLFHVQWDDDIFPREGQLALFDLLGSADKRLVAFTGPHAKTDQEAVSLWRDFIGSRLLPR